MEKIKREPKSASEQVDSIITELKSRAKKAGWPPQSIALHKTGNKTFKCAGISALFDTKSLHPSVNIYTPKIISLNLGAVGVLDFISAHIAIKYLETQKLITSQDAARVAVNLRPGNTDKLMALNADWTDSEAVRQSIDSYIQQDKQELEAKELKTLAANTKHFQLQQAGLKNVRIDRNILSVSCWKIHIDLQQNGEKWEATMCMAYGREDSSVMQESAIGELVETLEIIRDTLNKPFKLEGLEEPEEVGFESEVELA